MRFSCGEINMLNSRKEFIDLIIIGRTLKCLWHNYNTLSDIFTKCFFDFSETLTPLLKRLITILNKVRNNPHVKSILYSFVQMYNQSLCLLTIHQRYIEQLSIDTNQF